MFFSSVLEALPIVGPIFKFVARIPRLWSNPSQPRDRAETAAYSAPPQQQAVVKGCKPSPRRRTVLDEAGNRYTVWYLLLHWHQQPCPIDLHVPEGTQPKLEEGQTVLVPLMQIPHWFSGQPCWTVKSPLYPREVSTSNQVDSA